MNRITAQIVTLLFAIWLTGCQSTGPSGSSIDYAPLVDAACYTGTVVHLQKNPRDRPVFVTAEAALGVLVAQNTIAYSDLQRAFHPLLERSIKELRDPSTRLIIDNAVVLVDAYAGGLDTSTVSMAELRRIVVAARNGIARGLVVTSVPPPPLPTLPVRPTH